MDGKWPSGNLGGQEGFWLNRPDNPGTPDFIAPHRHCEGLWQPCVEQVYRHHFSDSVCVELVYLELLSKCPPLEDPRLTLVKRGFAQHSHLGGGAGAVSRGLLLESHVADAEVPAGSLPPVLALARTVPCVSFPARPADQQWQPAHSQNLGRRHTAESAWQLPTDFSTSSLYSVPLWRSTSVAFQFDSFITPLTSQVPLSIFSSLASPIIA